MNPPDSEQEIDAADLEATARKLLSFLERNHPSAGSVDILCIGPDGERRDIGTFAVLVEAVKRLTQQPPSKVTVLLLPGDHSEPKLRRIAARLAQASTFGEEGAELRLTDLAWLEVSFASSASSSAVIEALGRLPKGSTLIVADAAQYRGAAIEMPEPRARVAMSFGDTLNIRDPEDFWVPELIGLAKIGAEAAKRAEASLIFFAGEYTPIHEKHLAALVALDAGIQVARDGRGQLELQKLLALLNDGRELEMVEELERTIDDELSRALSHAQLLMISERPLEAYARLLPQFDQVKAAVRGSTRMSLARLFAEVGRWDLARELSVEAVSTLNETEEVYRAAHYLAKLIDDDTLRDRALHALSVRYPDSPYLAEARVQGAYDAQDYAWLAQRFGSPSNPSLAGNERYLAAAAETFLAAKGSLFDVNGWLERIATEMPSQRSRAVLDAARKLITEGRALGAIDCLDRLERDIMTHDRRRAAEIALRALEKIFVGSTSDDSSAHDRSQDFAERALLRVLDEVSGRPDDGDLRIRLTQVMATEAAGFSGVGLLLRAALDESRAPAPPFLEQTTHRAASIEGLLAFVKQRVEAWSPEERQVSTLEPDVIPVELRPGNAAALLQAGLLHLTLVPALIDDHDGLQGVLLTIKTCLDLSFLVDPEIGPFEVYRLGAEAFAASGLFGPARDIAEQCLKYSARDKTSRRARRNAWVTFADIYHRARNLPEAALGFAAARRIECAVGYEEAFWEMMLEARILRDLHAIDFALGMLTQMRALAIEGGFAGAVRHKLRKFTVEVQTIAALETSDGDQLIGLLEQTLAVLDDAVESLELLTPTLMLVAQVFRRVRELKIDVPQDLSVRHEKALELVPVETAAKIRTLAEPAPTIEAVIKLASTLEATRDPIDMSTDALLVAHLADRAMGGHVRRLETTRALAALELRILHAVRAPSATDGGPTPREREWTTERLLRLKDAKLRDRLIRTPEIAARVDPGAGSAVRVPLSPFVREPDRIERLLEELTADGREAYVLAADMEERLVVFSARDSKLETPVIVPSDEFRVIELEEWRRRLTYDLAFISRSDGLSYVERLVKTLRISRPAPRGDVILLTTPEISALPSNLLNWNGELLGTLAPVAIVPSFTWLDAIRVAPQRSVTRKLGWFFPTADDGTSAAIGMIRDITGTDLEARQFDLIDAHDIAQVDSPAADVVVLVAHGSLSDSQLHFGAVHDERGDARTVRHVASQIANTRIVILLVCSAGRIDPSPFSLRTVGLASQLLDRGCQTVVASPWPLSSSAACNWLPEFLRFFEDQGLEIARAVFEANRKLRARGPYPTDDLAMHTFGVPWLRAKHAAP